MSRMKDGTIYRCFMGIEQDVNEPCPKCGATEDTDEGCLGAKHQLEDQLKKEVNHTQA